MQIDIKNKTIDELDEVARCLREKIIDTISKVGGHFSSPLGAVELTIAMHYVFDNPNDAFIFDVSHQCYPHKLLTNRWDSFDTIRQFGGISGFTKPSESKADYFVAGHASTSISLAVGVAKAKKLKQSSNIPIVMIGDGSMSGGMIYEALNELGNLKLPVIIILNDNEMSIAKPIGAISNYLSKMLAGRFYQGLKQKVDYVVRNYMPDGSIYMAKKFEESLKLITPGLLFEELGIDYIGPIDGHNIKEIIQSLKLAKGLKKPVLLHAKTTKGKGYKIAQGKFEQWHGVSPFDKVTGKPFKISTTPSATDIFSDELLKLAIKYDNIVGVTAAMPSGTGLDKLMEKFPDRFWDVAITEPHAITSMGALAKEGFKPYIAIYSTFLQRGFDQIIHDICLMNLPVVFCIDRAGIVGADGETHQGVFDISFLMLIPNIILLSPRDNKTLKYALEFAYHQNSPCAIRYPRGSYALLPFKSTPFLPFKADMLQNGTSDILLISYGEQIQKAIEVDKILGQICGILDLRFVKPLDEKGLVKLSSNYKKWFIFSSSISIGGVGSAILELISKHNLQVKLKTFEYSDNFITQGDNKEVEKSLGLDPFSLSQIIQNNS